MPAAGVTSQPLRLLCVQGGAAGGEDELVAQAQGQGAPHLGDEDAEEDLPEEDEEVGYQHDGDLDDEEAQIQAALELSYKVWSLLQLSV